MNGLATCATRWICAWSCCSAANALFSCRIVWLPSFVMRPVNVGAPRGKRGWAIVNSADSTFHPSTLTIPRSTPSRSAKDTRAQSRVGHPSAAHTCRGARQCRHAWMCPCRSLSSGKKCERMNAVRSLRIPWARRCLSVADASSLSSACSDSASSMSLFAFRCFARARVRASSSSTNLNWQHCAASSASPDMQLSALASVNDSPLVEVSNSRHPVLLSSTASSASSQSSCVSRVAKYRSTRRCSSKLLICWQPAHTSVPAAARVAPSAASHALHTLSFFAPLRCGPSEITSSSSHRSTCSSRCCNAPMYRLSTILSSSSRLETFSASRSSREFVSSSGEAPALGEARDCARGACCRLPGSNGGVRSMLERTLYRDVSPLARSVFRVA